MRIVHHPTFSKELKNILRYIANDKPSASIQFKNELKKRINDLVAQPYQCRPSFYFDDINIRDMIFKKYTIVYEVNIDNDTIEIIRIFNRNKPD